MGAPLPGRLLMAPRLISTQRTCFGSCMRCVFFSSCSKQQKQQGLASWQTPQAFGLVALYLPLGLSCTGLGGDIGL